MRLLPRYPRGRPQLDGSSSVSQLASPSADLLIRALSSILACAFALVLPAVAQADLLEHEASFGSGVQPDARFVDAGGIATDDAGRVYVTDTLAGRVEVFESASEGNRFIRSFGEGLMRQPVGIAIDPRNRVYVVDSARHTVTMFDSLTDGLGVRREIGLGTGTELGHLNNPRHVITDRQGWVYVSERDTVRVQWFRPAGDNKTEPVSAFGLAEPATFFDPEGLTREDSLFPVFYVSDASETDGEVRMYDGRGSMLKVVAGPGTEPGQVTKPAGVALDPFGRLLVADAGNARLQVFDSNAGGSEFLGLHAGELVSPAAVASAPGALVYVADRGTGRVVRLRYDDADKDGALDPRDNCVGLPNSDQRDTDRDRQGDDCDGDDDNDTIADAADRCPHTKRGLDANRDGCGDPRSRIATPRDKKTYKRRRPPSKIVGTAFADELGVAGVEVAVALRKGATCRWYVAATKRLSAPASCDAPVWFRATGLERWNTKVSIKAAGTYRVQSRALQSDGVAENVFDRRNVRSFTVRR